MVGTNDSKEKKNKRGHASLAAWLKGSNKKRSPNSIAAAEIGFIDLTGEEVDSGFDVDREKQKQLGSVRRKLQSSSSARKRRKGTGGLKTTGLDVSIRVDGDGNDVIVLDSSDDENDIDAYNDKGGDDGKQNKRKHKRKKTKQNKQTNTQ